MAARGTHYEQAFEALLQYRRLRYVPINQTRKAIAEETPRKSFDFLVYPKTTRKLLIDVKGRKLSSIDFQRGRLGQNWTTTDDITSMSTWQRSFSQTIPATNCRAIFVFAYWLYDRTCPLSTTNIPKTTLPNTIYQFQQREYIFVVADLNIYQAYMRPRSARWNTVFLPTASFRHIAIPFEQFISTN
jgi:hypothetical protein